MQSIYIILVLLVQASLIRAKESISENEDVLQELNSNAIDNDNLSDEVKDSKNEWMDMFIGTNANFHPSSSAALMAQAAFSDKSPEEQLEEIKEIANQITMLIENEMANLLAFAIGCVDKGDKIARKKRSIESPMDSAQLVMRLLKHIKSNNEYQNIAIEKLMTAQEIADKYGIPFSPDTEILSDLAKAANEQATEMTSILKDSCDLKNNSQCIIKEQKQDIYKNTTVNTTQETEKSDANLSNSTVVPVEHKADDIKSKGEFDYLTNYNNYYYNEPVETQIVSPNLEQNIVPVTTRPTFYDTISYNPTFDYPYCSMEPMYNVQYPNEFELEPAITGEEYEETVSSKMYIEYKEPGAGTVNHVTTYTLSEKAHFKSPEIDQLPQQMQYYFLLI